MVPNQLADLTSDNPNIAVIGLGYVGLPLAIEFSRMHSVIGFDINSTRIKELKNNFDHTREISANQLSKANNINFTDEHADLTNVDIFIITVPTPIKKNKNPDLTPLKLASKLTGSLLKPGNYVIYESTVYPGCTEEFCIPILEKFSNLKLNKDFYCGYSPERINPADKKRSLRDIIKVTSGSCPEAAKYIDTLYNKIIDAGTFAAKSIKVAEAAKVIENTQRDINIALMNELSIIFSKMSIDTRAVLDAAKTKWNFLDFQPGLVGGHCIGVDPYYLTYKAKQLNYSPKVILAGREINDSMGKIVGKKIIQEIKKRNISVSQAKILVMGITFKENCPDIRNSKVIDLIQYLATKVRAITVSDPEASAKEVKQFHGIKMKSKIPKNLKFDAIIFAVEHKEFKKLTKKNLALNLSSNGFIFDLKRTLPSKLVDMNL